ncbi:spore coat protein U domain-containing protein [Erwinia aphidicola]|jgi:spore coat protein U-like protein|nr:MULTISPECIES: spore coat protein U domain-containing protein [Erwinia]KMV72631.1 polyketide synthase [bacteria symbiont BFo1 of Frankliniella occidentalis]PIJ59300.1 polyketide synthase [Erwinia sp. OLMDLW33]KYP86472.1 polyketide synthase [bacteria symbiont BFo1 of Frankliniella occidentalis]KYP92001.1 polyketide synthase [bacteria symbiont BFo1 of Frankliniella occidentalis]MBD1376247.1 spore coat protein U domain-containing protein [Erwinia aphidicola]
MKMKLFLLGCGLSFGVVSSGFAATTTGTIAARLVLTTGCLVNGQSATSAVNFGTLDFGSSAATFDTLNATLVGSLGNGIFVRCTTGQTYNVQLTSSNAAPATVYGTVTAQPRYLVSATNATQGVAYTLYGTTSYTTPIANNTNLTNTGTADPVNGDNYPIYGRIAGGGYNAAIPAGTYTDTINVAVNY